MASIQTLHLVQELLSENDFDRCAVLRSHYGQ